jgi:opacity protein-like surface antigen
MIAATTGGSFLLTQSTARAAGPAAAWSNCYLGAQAGAATSTSRWAYTNSNFYDTTGNTDPQLIKGAGFHDTRGVIGLQGGCNRAIGDWWVVGIEGAWLSNPMNEHNGYPGFFPDPTSSTREVITTNIQSVASVTGRLGIAPTSDWLLYGKGGYAVARIDTSGAISPTHDVNDLDFTTTNWHSGWTAGVGVEYRLFRNVTIGLEYDYYRFDSVAHTGSTSAIDDDANGNPRAASPVLHSVNADTQTLMGRINIGFDTTPVTIDSGPYAAYAAYVKAPPLAQPAANFSGFVTNEVKGSSWDGSRGVNVFAPDPGKGYQVYSPTTIGIDYLVPSEYKLETRLKSGYVFSAQNTAGQLARYEGPVDTQAAFNLTLLNFDSIRPLLGLNLNLPTGNTYLPNGQRFSRMDPDLVDVGSYGTGFNVNPTAGFIFGIDEHTAISLSAGWTWQGPFTKEGINLASVPDPNIAGAFDQVSTTDLRQKVSPGDTYTVNGNVSSTFGSLVLNGSFAYMGDSHASIDGVSTGRAGAKFTANGSANYNFDQRTALNVNVSWNFAEKNDVPDATGALVLEPKNSNSNVVIASIEPSYLATERLKLAVNYSYLCRDHNYYDPFQDQFVPAKQKHSAGASATYALTDAATVTLRGAHAWIRQDDGPILPAADFVPVFQPPQLKYQAWSASVATSLRF